MKLMEKANELRAMSISLNINVIYMIDGLTFVPLTRWKRQIGY